jgi:serine O-acetyltransferase
MSPAVIIYRIGNWFHRKGLKKIGKLFSYTNRILFSTWLPSSASIGKKFVVGYWGLGIVIHSNTKIGDNVLIAQNVTIGGNFKSKKCS